MMHVLAQLKTALYERYDIEREIGAGGMATVYLARDVRHDRHVALKVLNPELGAVLGVERFLAEIKVTANLQHPNLLPLFDSGEAGGLLFYVMPFVAGESLRARLAREKQLPIDEALRISVGVASALDYAHQHGVIHRDLKPENILLQAGQPVVADFGIALAVSNAGGSRITQTGLSLGTPQYMSPEQATGDRVIDGRSDIYSLAAMTYEMLSGEAPHTGNTAQAVIARVLTEKPRPVRMSRSAVPEHVEAALSRGLEKLAADRFSTAHEFAEALQGRSGGLSTTRAESRYMATSRPTLGWRARLRDPISVALAVLALASVSTSIALVRSRSTLAPMPPVRFILAATDSTRPLDQFPWPAAISPDGGTVVYSVRRGVGGSMLFAMRTDQLEPHPIPGTADAFQPLFSPDGKWIAFETAGKEKKVRLDGSAPVTISEGGAANGADWTLGDEIVLGASGRFHGLSRVSAAGGERVEFTKPDSVKGGNDHVWPVAAPDGKTIVFAIWSGSLATSRLALASLDDGKVVPLEIKGIRPLAVFDGVLIYLQADGAVMAVPFDASGKRTGKAIPVHDPIPVVPGNNGNSGIFISRGGAMVTSRGGDFTQMAWVDRLGARRLLSPEVHGYFSPRLSPDGRRIAVGIAENQRSDVWIYDLATTTLSRLTSVETVASLEWTPDGTRIVFAASGEQTRNAAWVQLAAGGAPARKLFDSGELTPIVAQSPDGKWLLAQSLHENSWDLSRIRLDTPRVAEAYLATRANEVAPRFSPDGRWVALVSDESGRGEVYVRSFPDPASRVQISVEGGGDPQWAADGSRVYYSAGNLLLEAKVSLAPTFRVLSRDTVLTQANFRGSGGFQAPYAVARDGKRILALISSRDDYQLVVAPNWRTELRWRLAGSGAK